VVDDGKSMEEEEEEGREIFLNNKFVTDEDPLPSKQEHVC